MIKLEFKNNETETFSGTSAKNGKPYSITKQTAWLHGSEDYPVKTDIMLQDATKPYAVGFYSLDVENSIYIDRNGRLSISPVLVAMSAKTVASI